MKKKVFIFALTLTALIAKPGYGQVGIGTMEPDKTAALDVVSPKSKEPLGMLIPRMNQEDRDKIQEPANGLLIFNTDEECINSFNADDNEWKSLCGGVAKSAYVTGCDDITVNGAYVKDSPLNSTNYLTVTVVVTKAGAYTISASTNNGYGFNASGTFLNEGKQQVVLQGQGKPGIVNTTPGDIVAISYNGAASVPCLAVTIPVLPPTANFSLSCGTAKFSGAYLKGKALTPDNKVTFTVNVSNIDNGGSWAVTSNTVNGISFAGSGVFTSSGSNTIELQGTGTPLGVDPITLTFTTNSGDGVATCNATVNIAIRPMTVLALGTNNSYSYTMFYKATGTTVRVGYDMVMDNNNFGTLPNSTVKFGDGTDTWKIHPTSGAPGATAVRAALNGTAPPDIVLIAVGWVVPDAATMSAFVDYLKKGGVVLMYCEDLYLIQAMLNAILETGTTITSAANGNSAGARYLLPIMNNDPLINGPFGNVGGMYWGEDASTTYTINNLPATAPVTVYTTATGTVSGSGRPTMLRHNTLSFIWVGDGGFNSSYNLTSDQVSPFYVSQTAPYIPLAKPIQYNGGNGNNGAGPVINAIFSANALAWAIQQAQDYGINSGGNN